VVSIAAGLPRARADEVLAQVDLEQAADRRVGGFSLGMRQRLALATALLGDPEVLVLDEPANGLDPEGIHWLRGFLRHLAGQGRTTGEFRHHTITQTFLTTSDRGRVVAAKLAAYALAGMAVAVLTLAVTVAVALPWMNAKGLSVSVLDGGLGRVLGGTLLAAGLCGLVGVGTTAALTRAEPGVVVRALDGARLGEIAEAAGWRVRRDGHERLVIHGASPTEVGRIAAREGIVLAELSSETPTRRLEELFLELTDTEVGS
jgi:ABC transporter